MGWWSLALRFSYRDELQESREVCWDKQESFRAYFFADFFFCFGFVVVFFVFGFVLFLLIVVQSRWQNRPANVGDWAGKQCVGAGRDVVPVHYLQALEMILDVKRALFYSNQSERERDWLEVKLDELGAISFCDTSCRKKLLGGWQVLHIQVSPCLDWLIVKNSIFSKLYLSQLQTLELHVRLLRDPLCVHSPAPPWVLCDPRLWAGLGNSFAGWQTQSLGFKTSP